MALECIETVGSFPTIIDGLNQLTGGLFYTLLLIMFATVFICLIFRLNIEWSAILIAPLSIGLMACDASFMPAGGALLLYLGILLAKNFFFR